MYGQYAVSIERVKLSLKVINHFLMLVINMIEIENTYGYFMSRFRDIGDKVT